jgi:predicted  nucleic acid-binding Zn-ribbon protein
MSSNSLIEIDNYQKFDKKCTERLEELENKLHELRNIDKIKEEANKKYNKQFNTIRYKLFGEKSWEYFYNKSYYKEMEHIKTNSVSQWIEIKIIRDDIHQLETIIHLSNHAKEFGRSLYLSKNDMFVFVHYQWE